MVRCSSTGIAHEVTTLSALAISSYRSLRDVRLALGPLNVVTGANGSGKSSLYRALRLLAEVAQGRVVQSLAAEGGLQSTLWAGPEIVSKAMKLGEVPIQGGARKKPVSLKLGFGGEKYGYAIDLGLPVQERPLPGHPPALMFFRDPEIKVEAVWTGPRLERANAFAWREGQLVRFMSDEGRWRQASNALAPTDSMMTYCADSLGAPEVLALRERMRSWRFYDHLRVDRDAPARRPQVGTHTPVLAGDGADLGPALQTIREIGDVRRLDTAIDDAFPGSTVSVSDRDGLFDVQMRQNGLLRPLGAAELSEGTVHRVGCSRFRGKVRQSFFIRPYRRICRAYPKRLGPSRGTVVAFGSGAGACSPKAFCCRSDRWAFRKASR